jgi:ABC-type enterochelin transport system permease subunit
MISRIALSIIMLLAIIHGWWFVALPIALIGMLRYSNFYEALVAGLAYDSLFGLIPHEGILSYIGSISAIVLFGAIMVLKSIMRK